MAHGQMLRLLATVEFPCSLGLAELAGKLSDVIQGFRFVEEVSGRFDEVPAYIAEVDGLSFVLFGVPEGESEESYVLEFSAETSSDLVEFVRGVPAFISLFVADKGVNVRGYLDYSIELADVMRNSGGLECHPVQQFD